jgi:hypothetical protein
MPRSLAQFSGPEASNHTPSLADFITITFGFRISAHTRGAGCPNVGDLLSQTTPGNGAIARERGAVCNRLGAARFTNFFRHVIQKFLHDVGARRP